MFLFKQKIVRWHLDGRRVPAGTPGAVRTVEESSRWYGQYRHPVTGNTVRLPLYASQELSQKKLARLAGQSAGAVADALAAFRRHLEHRNGPTEHVHRVIQRVQAVLEASGCRTPADLTAGAVEAFLGDMRTKGRSTQTRNHYLAYLRQFYRWAARSKLVRENPVDGLQPGNVHVDRRLLRRDLADPEIVALLIQAEAGPPRRGLSGPDRAMLYRTALLTGLRASELASLTPESFALDADPPTVTVAAAYSKHRREDVLPLHPALVEYLRPWLAGKSAGGRVWPGTWAKNHDGGDLFQRDLADAGLPALDTKGRQADFHALRHTFISNLARSGVSPKLAQVLARHSTITLTMDRYTHTSLREQSEALNSYRSPECNQCNPGTVSAVPQWPAPSLKTRANTSCANTPGAGGTRTCGDPPSARAAGRFLSVSRRRSIGHTPRQRRTFASANHFDRECVSATCRQLLTGPPATCP